MSRTITVVALVAAVIAVGLLAGCPKQQAEQLQGAPPPGSHVMPNGMTMPNSQPMPPPAAPTKPAASAKPDPAATTASADTASCPVLGTTMAKKDMIPYEYKGKTYYFCCQDCVTKFKANPDKYIQHPAKPLPVGAPMPSG